MASQPCIGQEKIFSINTRDQSASKYDDATNAYAQTFASPSPTHSATQSPRQTMQRLDSTAMMTGEVLITGGGANS